MHNVLGALRYMAEHGGRWFDAVHSGVWRLDLYRARPGSSEYVGFTQDELRAFLKHYEELSNKIGQLGEVTNEKRD